MVVTFTQQDAQVLLGFLASVVVPFVVGALARWTWPAWAKLATAGVVSLVAAILSQYAAGALVGSPDAPVSVVTAVVAVFVVALANYESWFKALGIDRRLQPDKPAPLSQDVRRLEALINELEAGDMAMVRLAQALREQPHGQVEPPRGGMVQ